jgi:hypothetical protein
MPDDDPQVFGAVRGSRTGRLRGDEVERDPDDEEDGEEPEAQPARTRTRWPDRITDIPVQ